MNRNTIKDGVKDAATIIGATAATVPALGLLLALGAGDWLRDRAPIPVLRMLTWGKRREWKRKRIPADPCGSPELSPYDRLSLSTIEYREFR